MVVIVILGLLATMVATNVIGASDEARIETTQTSAKVIHEAVKMFYIAERQPARLARGPAQTRPPSLPAKSIPLCISRRPERGWVRIP